MYSFEEVTVALETETLSDAIYKLQRFAESQGLQGLTRWCQMELDAYLDASDEERDAAEVYRSISVDWVTIYDKIVEIDPSASFLRTFAPGLTVAKIEEFTEADGLYVASDHVAALNKYATIPIKGARLTPGMMKALLSRIRQEARRRLHDSMPRSPIRKQSYAAPNFSILVLDPDLVRILSQRWVEANACFEAGAYLATVIMLGSILEGTLLAKAQQNPADANRAASSPKDQTTGSPLPFRQWTLQDLINVAYECGWLKRQFKNFSHVVREYRNFVHPNEERQQGITIDAHTCRVVWEVVIAALS